MSHSTHKSSPASHPSKTGTDTLETLHWLYLVEQRTVVPIKWLVLLLVIALMLFQPEERQKLSESLFQWTLAIYALTNLVFSVLFLGRIVSVEKFRRFSYLSFAADLLFVSTWVLLTGGLNSEFYFLFFLLILRSAALFQDPKKKFICDAILALFFLAGALVRTQPVGGSSSTFAQSFELVPLFFFRLTLLFGVMLISWFLVQALTSQQLRIKSINERLQYQSEQNREVLISMTDAVLVFDQSLQLRLCNPTAEKLLKDLHGKKETVRRPQPPALEPYRTPPRLIAGTSVAKYETGALDNRFWTKLTPDQIAAPIERLLEEVRFKPDKRIVGYPIILTTKAGKRISLVASSVALGEESAHQLGWLVLLRDVSEFQSMEAQLLEAEKLAAVGRLAAGLAHELGNPLGIIKSCANYLQKKMEPDSTLYEETGVLASEAERCQKILKQLLAFASQDQLHLVDFDLKELLVKTVNLIEFQAPEEVEIQFETEFDKAPTHADENLLTQAFLNLLLNAVQSVEKEGKVEVVLQEIEGGDWWITIRDTGCGMGKETLSRLFEPFYTTKRDGTGLGLAITQRIIDRLGGKIAVKSEPGSGTEFSILLPKKCDPSHLVPGSLS
ncbi:MAG: hypothetical protein KC944_07845 [Candidatus Omnitrophica bacterium]|nr:hypothetical protein [Candidatus Omnitrophota bacterium]MCA9434133.1 hypothetical protein [Candidatus Omnitrophota bacterium]MCA9440299.1 hypothetical protein [Candidatus Omnitrophota bacterium]MCB9769922.1 hypothetical protein [Candidatus Omnitrophota bacterium]